MPPLSSALEASFALDNKRQPARCFRGGRPATPRAAGFLVCDAYGNHWLDWSSGVVAGLHLVHPGGKAPDGDPTFAVVEKAFQKGLLLVVPVGFGGATLRVTPPLTITSDAVHEGLAVLAEAIAEAMVPPRQT